jgi:hypothetical protein
MKLGPLSDLILRWRCMLAGQLVNMQTASALLCSNFNASFKAI